MNSQNIKVSVIIPVYNSERYVEGAVRSVLAQSLDSFEVLLVDDGSRDRSGDICDQFERESPDRVRVFHKKNEGMCSARNFALKQAVGEYITFVDNDDECLPGFLEDNYLLAKKYDADCVRYGRVQKIIAPDGSIAASLPLSPSATKFLSEKEIAQNYKNLRSNGNGVWAGMYRRRLILENEIQFDERLRHGGEDVLFNLAVYEASRRIILNPNCYYIWKQRMTHSSSAAFTEDFFLGIELALEQEIRLMKKWDVQDSDPDFFGAKIGMYLREALSAFARSSRRIPYSESRECFERIRSVFSGVSNSFYKNTVSKTNRILLCLLNKRCYFFLYLAVVCGYTLKYPDVAKAAIGSSRA